MIDIILDIMLYASIGMIAAGVLGILAEVAKVIFTGPDTTAYVRLVPCTQLVSETILFTNDILAEKKIKHFPAFRIRYYRHKKYAGVFNGEVVIYMGSNPGVPELVDTVLHEVQHYVQSQTDKQYKYYDKYTAERGYWDNPFEVECREFAARHRDACLRHLESKSLIKRA